MAPAISQCLLSFFQQPDVAPALVFLGGQTASSA